MSHDERVDRYIASSRPFAQPLLHHVRALAHGANPTLDESIKWNCPAFLYKGKLVLGMAAFKDHATLNFWHGDLATGGTGREGDAMGSFGRLQSVGDLPDDTALTVMIQRAIALVDAGVKAPHMTNRQVRPELPVPPLLQAALDGNPGAAQIWEGFAPSHRREYCEWIGEAKRQETAVKRAAQAIEWIAEGKKRNWKYENC